MVEEEEKEEEGIRKEGNKSDKLNNDKQQTFAFTLPILTDL